MRKVRRRKVAIKEHFMGVVNNEEVSREKNKGRKLQYLEMASMKLSLISQEEVEDSSEKVGSSSYIYIEVD